MSASEDSPAAAARAYPLWIFWILQLFLKAFFFFENLIIFFSFSLFRLVIDTLKPLDPQRKCFRLVGGILVERTVTEVLPTLEKNHESVRPAYFPN